MDTQLKLLLGNLGQVHQALNNLLRFSPSEKMDELKSLVDENASVMEEIRLFCTKTQGTAYAELIKTNILSNELDVVQIYKDQLVY